MGELNLHADRSRPAVVHGSQLPWLASPQVGVERRPLERIGAEVALASSIVRYRPGSRFPAHTHGLGEEFLVLAGTFSDEQGDYPTGTYVRNPPGSAHAPFSDAGCVIFVKLRQMQAGDSHRLRVLVADQHWQGGSAPSHLRAVLHNARGVEVSLERLGPGTVLDTAANAGGIEVFVSEGCVSRVGDDPVTLERWGWLRQAGPQPLRLASSPGALLWVKRGHLP